MAMKLDGPYKRRRRFPWGIVPLTIYAGLLGVCVWLIATKPDPAPCPIAERLDRLIAAVEGQEGSYYEFRLESVPFRLIVRKDGTVMAVPEGSPH